MLKNVSVCNRIIVMTGNKQAYSTKTTMLVASEKLYLVSRLLYYGDEVSLKQTYYAYRWNPAKMYGMDTGKQSFISN